MKNGYVFSVSLKATDDNHWVTLLANVSGGFLTIEYYCPIQLERHKSCADAQSFVLTRAHCFP